MTNKIFLHIKRRVKKQENPFFSLLNRLYRICMAPPFPRNPILKFFFNGLYLFYTFAGNVYSFFKRLFIVAPLLYSQCKAYGKDIEVERLPYITGEGRLIIKNRARLSGAQSFGFNNIFDNEPTIVIGQNSFIGHAVSINAGKEVVIGDNCYIAGGCYISDTLGHPLDAVKRHNNERITEEYITPVTIGDDVWIGRGVIILPGTTIGARSVVGAGSVVTKDVPPDCISAGNPARVIKYLE